MTKTASVFLCLSVSLATACASQPDRAATGKGLLSFDREPPEGAKVYEAPVWTVGDHFVYRRGGRVRNDFRVVDVSEAGFVLEETGSHVYQKLTRGLAELARVAPDKNLHRVLSPADFQLSFPLWVGKKWSCNFIDRSPDGQREINASYHCDKLEKIETKAGTFECLRIWRTARWVTTEQFYDRVSVAWYSPEVGFFARRLEGDQLFELEEFEHQRK